MDAVGVPLEWVVVEADIVTTCAAEDGVVVETGGAGADMVTHDIGVGAGSPGEDNLIVDDGGEPAGDGGDSVLGKEGNEE